MSWSKTWNCINRSSGSIFEGHLWQVQHLRLPPFAFPGDEEAVLVDLEPAALLHLLLAPTVEGVSLEKRLVHWDVPVEDKRLGHPVSTRQLRTWKLSKLRGFNQDCRASHRAVTGKKRRSDDHLKCWDSPLLGAKLELYIFTNKSFIFDHLTPAHTSNIRWHSWYIC